MANELRPDDLGEVWRTQNVEHTQMTINEIREKARKFQRKIYFRNLRDYVAIAVVAAFFGYSMGKYPPLMRASAGLIIAGVLYVAYQLHRRGSSKTAAADLATASCLDFHRTELERQRDLLRGIWSWCLAPMIPGPDTRTRCSGVPASSKGLVQDRGRRFGDGKLPGFPPDRAGASTRPASRHLVLVSGSDDPRPGCAGGGRRYGRHGEPAPLAIYVGILGALLGRRSAGVLFRGETESAGRPAAAAPDRRIRRDAERALAGQRGQWGRRSFFVVFPRLRSANGRVENPPPAHAGVPTGIGAPSTR